MAVLFISPLCPDRPEYHTKALNRSGNNVLLGIANRLHDVLQDDVEFLCIPCVPSYPSGKFWIESTIPIIHPLRIFIKPVKRRIVNCMPFFMIWVYLQRD